MMPRLLLVSGFAAAALSGDATGSSSGGVDLAGRWARGRTSTVERGLGWWLHVDRRFEATMRTMAAEPQLFTSINVFHSNFSIAADGSLRVPSAASIASWLVPLRRAVPKAKVSVVLGVGHPEGRSDPFPQAAQNREFAPMVAKALSQHGLDGVNLDWENGLSVVNATRVLSSVIGALSRELDPIDRTVTLCVASGWLPYLDHLAWPAYEEAGVSRLMMMSTYPLTQPFSMSFEYNVLHMMLQTVRNKDLVGIGLWPKQGLGWTEPELRGFLRNVSLSGVYHLDIFCADLLTNATAPLPFWLEVLQEWIGGFLTG